MSMYSSPARTPDATTAPAWFRTVQAVAVCAMKFAPNGRASNQLTRELVSEPDQRPWSVRVL